MHGAVGDPVSMITLLKIVAFFELIALLLTIQIWTQKETAKIKTTMMKTILSMTLMDPSTRLQPPLMMTDNSSTISVNFASLINANVQLNPDQIQLTFADIMPSPQGSIGNRSLNINYSCASMPRPSS